MLRLSILLLLASCADDGSFDFSRVETNTTTTTITREPNEGVPSPDDSIDGSGTNPICLTVQDIGNGFLWKPVSESNGNLVVLFPKDFTETFQSVTVNGESGNFSGFANGDRQHWRFSKSGAEYEAPAIVKAISMGGECEWVIPNPSERTE